MTHRIAIPGIVKNGLVVPQGNAVLPDGLEVEIVFASKAMPPELAAEFVAWERVGDEAWGMIDRWEN